MRLGRLIVQLCALFIAGALIVGGYVYLRTQEVKKFAQLLNPAPENAGTVEDIMANIRRAPSMICIERGSDFYGAQTVQRYYHGGKLFIKQRDLTQQKSTYYIVNDMGYFVWDDTSDTIIRIPNEAFYDFQTVIVDVLFRDLSCSIWWNPSERVFDVPADRPIIDYKS